MDIVDIVTVIIPTHNYGRYIAEALDCLLQQTYSAWECLIVDDGSVDDTREVVARYAAHDARFHYLYQECQGVSAARNAGLSQAKGVYIQFLDADDLLPPRKLELHTQYLAQNPGVDIVYSDVRYFANDDQSQLSFSFDMANVEWLPKVDEAPNSAIVQLVQRNIMPIHAPLSRAKLLAAVGPFNKAMRHCEDWDYWFRCAVAGGQIRYLDATAALVLVRVHQVSASQNNSAMFGGGQLMTAQFMAYLKQHPGILDAPRQVAVKRARAIDLIASRHFAAGLLLGLSTAGQPTAGELSLRDVLYWFKRTLLATTPIQ
jgi:GT2 family glycosyltransferase